MIRRGRLIASLLATALMLPSAALAGQSGEASLRVADLSVVEGSDGVVSAVLKVSLDRASGRIITVDHSTVGGTATPTQDYGTTSGTLTFNKRQTSANVIVPIVADDIDEPDESFELHLSNPGGGARIADGVGIVTVLDDDEPGAGPADLSVAVTAAPASSAGFLTGDPHLVEFSYSNASGAVARDIRVRLTFDSVNPPTISGLTEACAVVRAMEVECWYGTTSAGGAGSLRAAYMHPGTYTITAAVESTTPDPAAGNNTRTSVLELRNRRANIRIDHFEGGTSAEQQGWFVLYQDGYEGRGFRIGDDENGEILRLALVNEGPDVVRNVDVRLSIPDHSSSTGTLRSGMSVEGITCPPWGEQAVSIACTIDELTAGAPLWLFFRIRPEFKPSEPASGIQVEAVVNVPANPDGTLIDESTGNDQIGSWGAIHRIADTYVSWRAHVCTRYVRRMWQGFNETPKAPQAEVPTCEMGVGSGGPGAYHEAEEAGGVDVSFSMSGPPGTPLVTLTRTNGLACRLDYRTCEMPGSRARVPAGALTDGAMLAFAADVNSVPDPGTYFGAEMGAEGARPDPFLGNEELRWDINICDYAPTQEGIGIYIGGPNECPHFWDDPKWRDPTWRNYGI